MRILLTALFLRIALHKLLSGIQWLALCLLVIGIAIVQVYFIYVELEIVKIGKKNFKVYTSIFKILKIGNFF
jgi:uncharacterized membrane protein (DUF2068 family)